MNWRELEPTADEMREAIDGILWFVKEHKGRWGPTADLSCIVRSEDGTRWLGVDNHRTYDLTSAVLYQARMIAYKNRQDHPIGY